MPARARTPAGQGRRSRPPGRVGALGVLLAAGLAAAPTCGRAADERPSLLLVTFDTTRLDHTSLAGYERDTTPRLRALAGEGASFSLAYAPTSTTGPTHATLFTGLSPLRHRVLKNGVPLPAEAVTLAERLGAAGYRTAAFVSSFVLSRRFAFAQGFATFDDAFARETSTFPERSWEGIDLEGGFDRRADETTRRALAWLERNAGRGPFFLFVHYFDPHAPYAPPEAFAGRFPPDPALDRPPEVRAYDQEIAFTDDQLARLLAGLEALGLAAGTLVVVTADHGEGLLDHGYMAHGLHIYEEQVRVPLVLRWPGRIAAGLELAGPVALADLPPTLYELLGVDPGGGELEGRSLAPVLVGREALDPERPVFLYRRHYGKSRADGAPAKGEKFGVRIGRFKLIEGPGTRELFDLEADPGERRNLAQQEPARVQALAAAIEAWRAGRIGTADAPVRLSPEERERLEALGYTE